MPGLVSAFTFAAVSAVMVLAHQVIQSIIGIGGNIRDTNLAVDAVCCELVSAEFPAETSIGAPMDVSAL